MEDALVPILFFFIVVGIPVLCGTVIALAKIIKGNDKASKRQASTDEALIIQEIHQGLSRLERRIEALETITLERSNKRTSTHSEI
jgi:hypothetical protein